MLFNNAARVALAAPLRQQRADDAGQAFFKRPGRDAQGGHFAAIQHGIHRAPRGAGVVAGSNGVQQPKAGAMAGGFHPRGEIRRVAGLDAVGRFEYGAYVLIPGQGRGAAVVV